MSNAKYIYSPSHYQCKEKKQTFVFTEIQRDEDLPTCRLIFALTLMQQGIGA